MLYIVVAPQLEISTASETTIAAGKDIILSCNITGGNPLPQIITWTYWDSNDQEHSITPLNFSTYILTSVQPQDSGMYRCSVMNEAGNNSDVITITVIGKNR